MAYRDGKFRLRKIILYVQRGETWNRMATTYLYFFWKLDHNFELARSILMKIVAFGVKGMTNEWAAAPCLGKFVVTRIRRPKVGRDGQNFWSRFMKFQYFLILAALPGAWAPGRRSAPKSNSTWLVETENPALVEQYYMYSGAKRETEWPRHIYILFLENGS